METQNPRKPPFQGILKNAESVEVTGSQGFTLIELIVVIAILGILALVAIPRFLGVTDRAQTQADETTATLILNAAEVAYIEDADDFAGSITGEGTDGDIGGLVAGGYLRSGNYEGFEVHAGTADGEFYVTGPDGVVVPEGADD